MDLHGGNIFSFSSEKQKNITDYSSNINPAGVSEIFKQAVTENFSLLERYPDPHYRELKKSIGEFNGVSPERIIAGNGAVEVLFLYLKALSPRKAMIISPTFSEYERGLSTMGCEITYHELREEEDFILDIPRLLSELKDEELLILCNPNNPTGKFIPLHEIERLNRELELRKIKFLIDESFIEFIEGWEESSSQLLRRENIFILRAFTKFFGIPGLRLGYGITWDASLLKKMQEIREPWSINTFAELAGKLLPRDRDYIAATYSWISEERSWFHHKLSENRNIKVYESQVNFILIKLFTMDSAEFKNAMLERDFLVRDASNFRFLDKNFIRLAVKDRENNRKIIKNIMEVTEWKQ